MNKSSNFQLKKQKSIFKDNLFVTKEDNKFARYIK